jgi:PIN domain nuclease of toxin-antitoxin system
MRTNPEEPRKPRRYYLDSSAYLCILLGEEGSERLSKEMAGAILMSSVLLILESKRNLVRLAREGVLQQEMYKICIDRLEKDMSFFQFRDLTLDLCQSSAIPAVTTPRSLDLAHLRTALWFHNDAGIDRFVTMDISQENAAKELGLPV